jgi:hypothetical protein
VARWILRRQLLRSHARSVTRGRSPECLSPSSRVDHHLDPVFISSPDHRLATLSGYLFEMMKPLLFYHERVLGSRQLTRGLKQTCLDSHRRLFSFGSAIATRVNRSGEVKRSSFPPDRSTRRFLSGSTGASLPDWGNHSIFVSTSDDPYFNLSLEDMFVPSFFEPTLRHLTQ